MAMLRSVSSFQPRVGVDEQIVEHELVDQILETIIHEAHVVAFTQHLGDLCGMEARRDEPDASPGLPDPFRCHVHGRLSNAAPLPQVVIQSASLTRVLEPE